MRCLTPLLLALLACMLVTTDALAWETTEEHRFEVTDSPSTPFDVVQMVLDFPPGASVAKHTHGGPGFITMIAGELALSTDGVETTYRMGDSFVEYPVHVYEGHNPGEQTARLMVTYLIPEGNEVTTVVEENAAQHHPVGPQTVSSSTFHVTAAPETYSIVHRLHALPADSSVEDVSPENDSFSTVVEGSIVLDHEGKKNTLDAGDSWSGSSFSAANASDETAYVVTTVLSQNGAGTGSAGQVMPQTGREPARGVVTWVIIVAGLAFLTGGGLVRARVGKRG